MTGRNIAGPGLVASIFQPSRMPIEEDLEMSSVGFVPPQDLLEESMAVVDYEGTMAYCEKLTERKFRDLYNQAVRILHRRGLERGLRKMEGLPLTPPSCAEIHEIGAAFVVFTLGNRRGLTPLRIVANVNREIVRGVRDDALRKSGKLRSIKTGE